MTKFARRLTICLLSAASLAVSVGIPANASAAKCFGKQATEVGSGQGETIRGTAKKDVIASKGGADKLKGKGGKDRLCGGRGRDKISGGAGKDKAKGGAGADKVNGGGGRDRLLAGKGNDKARGGGGNDFLDGGKGTDTTNGGPGTDTCVNAEVVLNCENQDPALHFDDQIDWGFTNDFNNESVDGGEQVNTVLRIGNGIAGARGYAQSTVAPEGFIAGSIQTLTFPGLDDENTVVSLPRPIDFFGIRYTQIAVGTNGFVSFGAPALDYFTDREPTPAQLGEFYRGAFPLWADLDLAVDGSLGDLPGQVFLVTSGDAIAVQWKDMSYHEGGTPERNFQLVFFSDGRIRFDYPGSNDSGADVPGGDGELVGLTGGSGASSYTEIQRNTGNVPGSSILFTPNGLGVTGAAPTGTATAAIPADATFVAGSTDPRCTLTTAPSTTAPGLATCATPVLNSGVQDAFQVSWLAPASEPDMTFNGTYQADGFSLIDSEQLLLDTF